MQTKIENALADYIHALSQGLEATHEAAERPVYTKHLAAAAMIFAYLNRHEQDAAMHVLQSEQHAIGWSYLTGEAGDQVEKTFGVLVQMLKSHPS
jgi:hypothetical protein